MARIAYPFDPNDLQARNPPFVQDLLELKRGGYVETVSEISKMVVALKEQGNDSGFLKKLRGTPISELKSHSRGGQKVGHGCTYLKGWMKLFSYAAQSGSQTSKRVKNYLMTPRTSCLRSKRAKQSSRRTLKIVL